jgi:hypothetical protein
MNGTQTAVATREVRRRLPAGPAVIVVAALLALFAFRSWRAVEHESPTFDEPVHFLDGVAAWKLHDFRLNTEHPVLWKLWAALPVLGAGFHFDTSNEDWQQTPTTRQRATPFVVETLFRTPGNDTRTLLARGRFMMLLVGIALGGMIALWAWRVGGGLAACVAVFVYSLDPNFLAHAPLVTNDVAFSLAFCATMYCVWRVGIRAGWKELLALILWFGVVVQVKYSGLVVGPIVLALLGVRALTPEPWLILGRRVSDRKVRAGFVGALAICAILLAFAAIWGAYGFRYGVAPNPQVHLDPTSLVHWDIVSRHASPGDQPPRGEPLPGESPGAGTRVLLALQRFHVLPEAFLNGLLYVHVRAGSPLSLSYFLGRTWSEGHWSYFPVAMLAKTPIATLLAFVLAGGVLLLVVRAAWRTSRSNLLWLGLCFVVPPLVYFVGGMAANLNIGVRHVFPVYPFLFIATGIAAAAAWRERGRFALPAGAVLAVAISVESLAASPHYLSFFNAAVGGARGGFRLLGDSNLDWGQGLPLLADWQQRNPTAVVQLAYFGNAPPEYYGVHATNVVDEKTGLIALKQNRGVVAVSATILQLMTFDRNVEPLFVLGGSLYLYRVADFLRGATGAPPQG